MLLSSLVLASSILAYGGRSVPPPLQEDKNLEQTLEKLLRNLEEINCKIYMKSKSIDEKKSSPKELGPFGERPEDFP